MKFWICRTSKGGIEKGEVREFKTLEELLDWIKELKDTVGLAGAAEVILYRTEFAYRSEFAEPEEWPPSDVEWAAEIYDDYRE